MIEIGISDQVWDLAADFVRKYFPEENIAKKFYCEDRVPNMQGLLGELAFIDWLQLMPVDEYMEMRPTFRRNKGIDLVVGNYKIDIKTPTLRVPPKKYHRILIEKALVDKHITDIFACQFIIRPEMNKIYFMGYATPEDVLAFGEPRKAGEALYGSVAAGYDGYLIACEHLQAPETLKGELAGLKIGDPLMAH
jgi:hypothetical protein